MPMGLPPPNAPAKRDLERDLACLARWRAGDHEAGMELLDHYSALIRMVAFRAGVRDRDDLLELHQDLALRLLDLLPTLAERIESSFSGWLHWQVRDLAKRHRRRGARAHGAVLPTVRDTAEHEPAERAAAWDAIAACRDHLPQREREVFELRFVGGMSLREVAEQLQSNDNAVAQAVFRLVRRMRECLGAKGYDMPGAGG